MFVVGVVYPRQATPVAFIGTLVRVIGLLLVSGQGARLARCRLAHPERLAIEAQAKVSMQQDVSLACVRTNASYIFEAASSSPRCVLRRTTW